jgi:hypothetical protein
MSQALYRVTNGPSPGAAATPKVTTGTVIKTLMQIVHPTLPLTVVEWGISFDGTAAATPIECELVHTQATNATVTAYVANDITSMSAPGGAVPGLTLGTATSGYTATAEGTISAPVRVGDYQQVSPTGQYLKQFPLGQEFSVPALGILRVRVTAAAAVNAVAYVVFEVG